MGTPTKLCTVCGKDVSQIKRTKDTQDNYYCSACWAEVVRAAHAHKAPGDTPVPTQIAGTSAARTSDRTAEQALRTGLSGLEKFIIAGGIVVGLLAVGLLMYFLVFRDRWENQNREQVLALVTKATVLAKEGKLEDAKLKYDELFRLVGDRKIKDGELQDTLQIARDSQAIVAANLVARQEAERQRQEQERLAKEQAERDRKEQQHLAQQRVQSQKATYRKSIADQLLAIARQGVTCEGIKARREAQMRYADTLAREDAEVTGNINNPKSKRASDEAMRLIQQEKVENERMFALMQAFLPTVKRDESEVISVAKELINDSSTPADICNQLRKRFGVTVGG